MKQYPFDRRFSTLTNAEVEDKETIMLPDGNTYSVNGKKHSQGGEEVFLPEGSLVFSEKLKLPAEVVSEITGKNSNYKKSPAQLSKRYDTNKYQKIMDSRFSDPLAQKTAQMMFDKNRSMQETIFQAQEEFKEDKEYNKLIKEFKLGGLKKYQDGGVQRYNQELMKRLQGLGMNIPDSLDYSETVPMFQRSSGANRYGDALSLDQFQANNPWYTQDIDPSIPGSVKAFQQAFNTELKKRALFAGVDPDAATQQHGFHGTKGPQAIDDKFGEYTSTRFLPSFKSDPLQPIDKKEFRVQSMGQPKQQTEQQNIQRVVEQGIDPRKLIDGVQQGLLLSQLATLERENPYHTYTPLKAANRRFEPINTKQAERAYNIARESLENSSLPASAKQARLTQLQTNLINQMNQVDITNYQNKLQVDNQNTQNLINTANQNNIARTQSNYQYVQEQARGRELMEQQKASFINNALNLWRQSKEQDMNIKLLNQMSRNYNFSTRDGVQYVPGQGANPVQNNPLQGFQNQGFDMSNLTPEDQSTLQLKITLAQLGLK